jgi:hypothetical protein
MTRRFLGHTGLALATLAAPAAAQEAMPTDFTTPAGAAFIHQSIKDQILSFGRPSEAEDYIYFTALLSWRCGVLGIYYGFNDNPPDQQFPMEPCYRDLREPNMMQHAGEPGFPIFLAVPAGSVQKVTLRILYEDGKIADFVSERQKNLIN